MKQPIRAFALGLLSAGIIMLISSFISGSETKAVLSVDEMVQRVEGEGYHVMTESEYISVSVDQENESDKEKKEAKKQTSDDKQDDKSPAESIADQKESTESKEKTKQTYTLTVESGMAPSTISTILMKNNIIKSDDEFTNYLEEQGYSTKVQLGEFKLTSEMSFYELAETLTN